MSSMPPSVHRPHFDVPTSYRPRKSTQEKLCLILCSERHLDGFLQRSSLHQHYHHSLLTSALHRTIPII